MKKLTCALLATLSALFLVVSLTACSSDDEAEEVDEIENQTNRAAIVGVWELKHFSGWAYDAEGNAVALDVDMENLSKTSSEYLGIVAENSYEYIFDGTYFAARADWYTSVYNDDLKTFSYKVYDTAVAFCKNGKEIKRLTLVSVKSNELVLQTEQTVAGETKKTTCTYTRMQ